MKDQDRTTMACLFNALVLLVVVSFINAEERDLYVDSIRGEDNKVCTVSQPCRRIRAALDVLHMSTETDSGILHLYGNHSLNGSMNIKKDLTIRGYGNASITSQVKSEPSFFISKKLSLISLRFERITPFRLSPSQEKKVIAIQSCQFYWATIEVEHHNSVYLSISRSNFTDTTVEVSNGTNHWLFILSQCTFITSIKSHHLMRVQNIGNFYMSDTVFLKNDIERGCVEIQNLKSVSINNSKFMSNYRGAFIRGSKSVLINNSAFVSNTNGALQIEASHAIISNTKFKFNRAPYGAGLTSKGATLTITNSHFVYNTVTKGGGGLLMLSSSINIKATEFISNRAGTGGAGLFWSGTVVTITASEFFSNTAGVDGGGLFLSGAVAVITKSKFESNNAKTRGGGFYVTASNMRIKGIAFISNVADDGGGLFLSGAVGSITDSKFESNNAKIRGGGFYMDSSNIRITSTTAISNRAGNVKPFGGGSYIVKSNVTIEKSLFKFNQVKGRGAGLSMDSSNVTITDTEFTSNAALVGQGGGIFLIKTTAIITNSKFVSNTARDGGGLYLTLCNVNITKTNFISNNSTQNGGALMMWLGFHDFGIVDSKFITNTAEFGGSLNIHGGRRRSRTTRVENTSFFGNSANNGGAFFITTSGLILKESVFLENSAYKRGGAISLWKVFEIVIKKSIFRKCSANVGDAILIEDSPNLIVDGSTFKENSASSLAGGIYLVSNEAKSSRAIIKNSTFVNNSAPSLSISSNTISIADSALYATTNVPVNHFDLVGDELSVRSVFALLSYPKVPQSNILSGLMTLTSTSGRINVTRLDILCSRYFYAEILQESVQSKVLKPKSSQKLEVYCATCGPGEFSLKNSFQVNDYQQTLREKVRKCKPCPSGAVCNGHVKVLDGYWGIRGKDDSLTIFNCPKSYCCSSQTTPCTSFDTCKKGREGALCGRCKAGYFQSVITGDCILKDWSHKCNIIGFAGFFVMVSWIYTLVLTFLPALFERAVYLARKIKGNKDRIAEDEDLSKEFDITQLEVDDSACDASIDDQPIPMGAVVTQVIFFYQLASLVHIDVLQRTHTSIDESGSDKFTAAIFDAVNFQVPFYFREICSIDKLTLVHKMCLQLGIKMFTILNIFCVSISYKIFVFIKSKLKDILSSPIVDKPAAELEKIDSLLSSSSPRVGLSERSSSSGLISFNSRLKIGLLKLLKFNFTSTMAILFQLVHCITLRHQPRLYVFADHICYVWWQWLIIAVVVPTLAIFPVSFGRALDLLKARAISPNIFLVSCMLPFAFFFKRKRNRAAEHITIGEEENLVIVILEQEEELFDEERKGIRWPVIQLYRMLVIVTINTFILNPIFKSLLFSSLFLAFFAHDGYRMPFKNPFLNHMQCFTSACLFLVNLCSVPSAFSSVGNITSVPNMRACLTMLRYLELCLCVIVLLPLPMWKLWRKLIHRERRRQRKAN